MSILDRAVQQQQRAHANLPDDTITINGTDYDAPVVAQSAERDNEAGLEIAPAAIHVWLSKEDYPDEPSFRMAITWREKNLLRLQRGPERSAIRSLVSACVQVGTNILIRPA